MGNLFYSPGELYRTPYFVMNLFITLVSVVLIVLTVAVLLKQNNNISINPIADIGIVSHPSTSTQDNLKPMPASAILSDFNRDQSVTSERVTFFGYLAYLRDVCNIIGDVNASSQSLVLVKTRDGLTAGTITISKKTCDLLYKINKPEPEIYVVSDIPFQKIPSEGKEFYLIKAVH
jgi:hypothetical protein